MTTLTLYKGVDFDGVNSFPYISSKAAFDAYLVGKQHYTQGVHYNRIGEPILINENYDVAMGYCYGCIDTGDRKYFIIPDTISVNENNRVYLTYSVDWFTTLAYDGAISFGRAHLVKSTGVDPLSYQQNIQPIDMRVKSDETLKNEIFGYNQEIIIIYTEPDSGGSVKQVFSPLNDNGAFWYSDDTRGLITLDIYNGRFLSLLDVPPDNILGIFFSPIAENIYTYSSDSALKLQLSDGTYIQVQDVTANIGWQIVYLNSPITTTSTKVGVITDTLGNIIYTVPYGRTVSTINFRPMTSLTQHLLEISFTPAAVLSPAAQNAENSSILYACEKIDYISDAYKNWAYGLKGVEMEERRIQKNKSLMTGIGGSAMTGAIGGASGNPWGALAGVAGGVGSALLTYGIDTYYESQVNSLEDRKYQLAQDTMMPGSYVRAGFFHAIQLEASPSDIARYDAEISNFGADCNLPVASWAPSPGAYKFADVEVIADVPYGVKQNIKQKMMSGIKIVGVN